ncbi:MAG: hypothetical protein ABI467_05095 [Kofleriaceae bacterium]
MNRPVLASRPRTLVVTLAPPRLDAAIVGPDGAVHAAERVAIPDDLEPALRVLWELVERLGDFDRISAGCDRWDEHGLAAALQRESFRPARVASLAELAVAIEHTGVELVLTLDETFRSSLFLHGARAPTFALERARFRKRETYAEYLSAAAYAKHGRKKWNKRVHRVIGELLEIYAPHRLYVTGRDARLIYGELSAEVTIATAAATSAALALWA